MSTTGKTSKRRSSARKRPADVVKKTRGGKALPQKAAKKKGTPQGERRRGWSLSTLPSVRRRLAQICSDLDRGYFKKELGISMARTQIYALSTIAGILKAEAEIRIEERILALEAAAGLPPGGK